MSVKLGKTRIASTVNTAAVPLSTFLCQHIATLFFLTIALVGSANIPDAIICTSVGVMLDVIRSFLAPELRMSVGERRDSLLRAIGSKRVASEFLWRARIRSSWIYVLWAIYVAFYLMFPEFRSQSLVTQNAISLVLVNVGTSIYPVTRGFLSPQSYPTSSLQLFSTIQILTISWWMMTICVVLEVSGGAFFRLHFDLRKFAEQKFKGQTVYGSDKARLWVCIPCLFFLYFLPEYSNLLRVLPPSTVMPQSHHFLYVVTINALSVMSCAPLMRVIYSVILSKASNLGDMVASITREEIDSFKQQ